LSSLATANALGLTVSTTLLTQADEVIEWDTTSVVDAVDGSSTGT
jgi:hypothetical protein